VLALRSSATKPPAGSRCSKLSSTRRSFRSRTYLLRCSSSGRPRESCSPMPWAIDRGTSAGSVIPARETKCTPSGYSSATPAASSMDNLVLPQPPGPVRSAACCALTGAEHRPVRAAVPQNSSAGEAVHLEHRRCGRFLPTRHRAAYPRSRSSSSNIASLEQAGAWRGAVFAGQQRASLLNRGKAGVTGGRSALR
jgi:hypothetical protein